MYCLGQKVGHSCDVVIFHSKVWYPCLFFHIVISICLIRLGLGKLKVIFGFVFGVTDGIFLGWVQFSTWNIVGGKPAVDELGNIFCCSFIFLNDSQWISYSICILCWKALRGRVYFCCSVYEYFCTVYKPWGFYVIQKFTWLRNCCSFI